MARFKSRKQHTRRTRSRKTYGGAFDDLLRNITGIVGKRGQVGTNATLASQYASEAQALASAAVKDAVDALKAAQAKEQEAAAEANRIETEATTQADGALERQPKKQRPQRPRRIGLLLKKELKRKRKLHD